MTTESTRLNDTVTIYRDADRMWRWRRQAANGEIIAVSGEGYHNASHAKRMAAELFVGHTITTTATPEEN